MFLTRACVSACVDSWTSTRRTSLLEPSCCLWYISPLDLLCPCTHRSPRLCGYPSVDIALDLKPLHCVQLSLHLVGGLGLELWSRPPPPRCRAYVQRTSSPIPALISRLLVFDPHCTLWPLSHLFPCLSSCYPPLPPVLDANIPPFHAFEPPFPHSAAPACT